MKPVIENISKYISNLYRAVTRGIDKAKLYSLLALFTASLAFVVAMILTLPLDFSVQEGEALVQGELERGHDYVGYIISDKNKVCAGTLLNENTIVTAAHCLAKPAGNNFKFGIGEFSLKNENLAEISAVQFTNNYNIEDAEGADIAVAKLTESFDLPSYPKLSAPTENCNAKLVAYGAGVESLATEDMFKKKSGVGCVRAITSSFLIRFGNEVGMCFGDSGGPIFSNSNNDEIVGILSGGIIETELDTLKCEAGNTGYAINIDTFDNFINGAVATDFSTSGAANIRLTGGEADLNFNTAEILADADNGDLLQSDAANSAQASTNLQFQRIPSSFYWQLFGGITVITLLAILIIKYI